MGKACSTGCCAGSSCCGCCCSKRAATITFSLIGLLLAVAVIAPPVYVYTTDKNFSKLLPWLNLSKKFLHQVTESRENALLERNTEMDLLLAAETDINGSELMDLAEPGDLQTPHQKYKLAIFQLLDDITANAVYLSFCSFCIGCLNVPVHLLLLCGAGFRVPCLMLPWLAVTLLEHLLIGVPIIVFCGIIALYLAAQLQLYLVAGALIGTICMAFLLSISSWFTVHACYNMFYRRDYLYVPVNVGPDGTQVTQPLLPPSSASSSRSNRGPALPPGHPSANAAPGSGYHLGQYPQYYPPHHNQSRQLPTAPPNGGGGGPGMYPQLPNA